MRDNTNRFSDRADAYVRARPGYPAPLLDWVRQTLAGRADPTIADVGSGTGLLTELLLQSGHPVHAVEPNGPMRAAAEQRLGSDPRFHSVNGTAEATGLPDHSIDLVTAAQAFHWFDVERARAECRRILRPGGRVALIWNDRRSTAGFTADYQALVARHRADRTAVEPRIPSAQALNRFFGPAGHATQTFDNPQQLDRDGVLARLDSSSYMPLPSDPRHAPILAEANAIFDRWQQDGVVTIEHDTRLFHGPISG